MKSDINRLPKGAIEIKVEIPWKEAKEQIDKTVDRLAQKLEIKGFRKGKAPKKIVIEKIGQDKLYQETLSDLIPELYRKIVTENDLKPIVNPQVQIDELKPETVWKFQLKIAQAPEVNTQGYEKIVKKIKKDNPDIWVPGKGADKEQKDQSDENERLSKILEALLEELEVEVADIIIEQEANRLLSQSLDEMKSLGMGLDSYLASTGKSREQFVQEHRGRAARTLKLEFILQEISEQADIQVSQEELNNVFSEHQGEQKQSPEEATPQLYQLASLLRRQKTIKHLLDI